MKESVCGSRKESDGLVDFHPCDPKNFVGVLAYEETTFPSVESHTISRQRNGRRELASARDIRLSCLQAPTQTKATVTGWCAHPVAGKLILRAALGSLLGNAETVGEAES